MSQIKNKFIEAATGSSITGVTGDKMRLENAQPLRARNAANSADVNILDVNSSNVIEVLGALSMTSNQIHNVTDPSSAQDAATKNYVDTHTALTVGTIDTNANSNGLFISGTTISTQSASASNPGMVNNTTQTMSGAKTFSTSVQSPAFISNTANPASSGVLRLANATDYINFRNGSNSGDLGIRLLSGNHFEFGTDIWPAIDNLSELGDSTKRWNSVNATMYYATSAYYLNTNSNAGLNAAFTGPDGNTYDVALNAVSGLKIGVMSTSSAAANATATPDVSILTGNKTAGTGNSGSIRLTTGTSSGGTQGSVLISALNTQLSGPLVLNGSTSGTFTQQAAATTTSYSITWPSAQGGSTTYLQNNGSGVLSWASAGAGSVTSVSVVSANGFAGTVATPTSTPAITISTSINASLLAGNGTALSAAALAQNDIYVGSASNLPVAVAMSGDATIVSSGALTLATVATAGTTGSSTAIPVITINAKGLTTSITTAAVVAPAGTLSGTTLNSTVVTSSLTSLGTQSQALNMGSNQINNVTDPTSAQDAATKNYVDNAINGLTWKGPVMAYSVSNVPLTGGASLTIDGYSVQNGDYVILSNQTTASQNNVYSASGIGTAYTLTLAPTSERTTAIGDAYLIEKGTVYSNSAVQANAISPNNTYIQFAGPNSYSFTSPLLLTGTTVSIGYDNSTIGDNGSNQLYVKNAGITQTQIASSALSASGGLSGGSGTTISVNVEPNTEKINGSNQVEGLKPISENLTLSAGDITNQYKDLSHAIYGQSASVNSAILSVVGSPIQQKTVDYTVSLTGGAGGVTRITFAGDLATAGNAALVSGDILMVSYSYL